MNSTSVFHRSLRHLPPLPAGAAASALRTAPGSSTWTLPAARRFHAGGTVTRMCVRSLKVPADRPTPPWFFLPALVLVGLVWLTQGLRMRARVVPA